MKAALLRTWFLDETVERKYLEQNYLEQRYLEQKHLKHRLVNRIMSPVVIGLTLALAVFAQTAHSADVNPEVEEWVLRMEREHQFDAGELRDMLAQFKPNQTIIKAINTPATSKPWSFFQNLYVTESRVDGGVVFWNEYAELLERARIRYGVPEEVVTSIIGIESQYGKRTGRFQVADALYTLGFAVPRRSKFFRSQFEHFLLLTRENGFDPLEIKGSFAGAMGIPQFIPSSYRDYAVDFDGDGRTDLWNSVADAVGSVANYLSRFGWDDGGQVVVRAKMSTDAVDNLESLGVKPSLTMEQFRARGVEPEGNVADDMDGGFFVLEAKKGPQYWISLNNFYVITRYNRSKNYAMAVHQLSQKIARKRNEQIAAVANSDSK
jgi:membrane-bound lytic murein transglycosylase B